MSEIVQFIDKHIYLIIFQKGTEISRNPTQNTLQILHYKQKDRQTDRYPVTILQV